jgi:hypothetical protein
MKTFRTLVTGCALATAMATTTFATNWTVAGFVYCDANQNGQIDATDTPLPGVLVVVTNTSGTYSNGVFTATPDGGYIMQLPAAADSYVAYLHPLTLPSDATVTLPSGGTYSFALDSAGNYRGDFLVSSSICSGTVTNPPSTNACELKACGTIQCGRTTTIVFGGEAHPGCGSTNGDFGKWEVVAVHAKLHLEGEVFEIVNCGELTESNCTRKFIEFQGIGTLKGINGCRTNYGVVYFFVHAEDGAGCKCGDRIYARVYTPEGGTVLLISGDTSDDQDIAPVSVSTGGIAITTFICPGGCHGGHGEGDEHGHGSNSGGDKGGGHDNGDHGKGGSCDNGNKGDKGDKGDKGSGKQGSDCNNQGEGSKGTKSSASNTSSKSNAKKGK